ncbi:MAG: MBOAT family O-acyltransferase [Terriglobales bacterium]
MVKELLLYSVGVLIVWLIAMRLRSAKARQILYLVASWIFYYSWGGWLIVILIFSSLMNYGLGEWLKKKITAGRLWVGLIANLALLCTFKYLPTLGADAASGSPLAALKHIIFPIGVSFWTFEALSYLLEIYREEDLDPTLVEFCLFMSFWPTVIQGPICRLSSLLPQFRQEWSVNEEDLSIGIRRVAIGILMAALGLLMAGGLHAGAGVEAVFENTTAHHTGIDVWFMVLGYAFELYFSFCGWTHLMIGASRLFGIQLQENFDRPYLSTTPSIFWTRWHMSLSFWIRDFLFLPLATARREAWWRNLSLVISMFVFGLWHGATLLYMMWGIYHGLLMVFHRQWQEFRKRVGFEWAGLIPSLISWAITFTAVCVGYIFFNAKNVAQAGHMLKAIVTFRNYGHVTLDRSFCVMTLVASVGYFAVIGGGTLLDRLAESAKENRGGWLRSIGGLIATERWVWITPIVVIAALYLTVMFQPGHAETGPVMYALF